MKPEKILLIITLFSVFPYCIQAKEIISIEGGLNYLPNNIIEDTKYIEHIKMNGIYCGILIPLHIDFIDIHFRLTRSKNNVNKVFYKTWDNRAIKQNREYWYIVNINELLIGKNMSIFKDYEFLPQIGIGHSDEICASNDVNAIRDHYFFYSICVSMKRRVNRLSVGFIAHAAKGFYSVHSLDKNSSIKIKVGMILSIY